MKAPKDLPLDALAFRDRMGRYASGITIIGGLVGDEPAGFTCQSFYSVSSDPPLVSFCVMKTSTSWPRIRPGGRFSVNVLSEGQQEISRAFARSGGQKWLGIKWGLSLGGNPLIEKTLMWLDCEVFAEHEAGDHFIVIGKVKDMSPADWHEHGTPLLYFRGQYHHLRSAATA
ncbi:flavin reductase family protein [Bosea sp. BK604]|uniref:flavin reductase family protein n=1 Tax=Bosea sp. BK604 TaxID=2512180 RepID=UPI001044A027|nr:flavin reductase family protein [Bosea sp. BK604]TCR60802.1 flavin reductase (DIM6/NTAB) family NADH-FMN oxidoreductase RutF [Bosea sp. BK604]